MFTPHVFSVVPTLPLLLSMLLLSQHCQGLLIFPNKLCIFSKELYVLFLFIWVFLNELKILFGILIVIYIFPVVQRQMIIIHKLSSEVWKVDSWMRKPQCNARVSKLQSVGQMWLMVNFHSKIQKYNRICPIHEAQLKFSVPLSFNTRGRYCPAQGSLSTKQDQWKKNLAK